MRTSLEIQKAIMRRVYAIYYFRQALKYRLTVFLGVCLVIASTVSMPNVIANAAHSANFLAYLLSALGTTKLYVQLGVFVVALITLSALVEILRPRSGSKLYA